MRTGLKENLRSRPMVSAMTVATERGGATQFARVKSREENIYVTVRVRPLSAKEVARSDVSDWVCSNGHTIAYKHALPERSPFPAAYTFGELQLNRYRDSICSCIY